MKCPAMTGIEDTICVKKEAKTIRSKYCPKNTMKITFKNRVKETVSLQWWNTEGKMKTLYKLKPGKTKIYNTCEGHFWSFVG